jgi:hypothetical protein
VGYHIRRLTAKVAVGRVPYRERVEMGVNANAESPGRHQRLTLSVVLSVLVVMFGVSSGAQPRPSGQVVVGVAVDATGAVLPNAQVTLTAAGSTTVIATAAADATGTFRFASVPPGRYDVAAAFEGFQPTVVHVTVGTRPPSSLRVVLPLANMTQQVTVTSQATQVDIAASANSDAVTLNQDMMAGLPMFDQDFVATLSRFLDAGSMGNGGATVVVNGMEVNALRVSASAVQQIKINQDPYSAEYSRPGRGRIEILTKPGSQEYHGEGNVTFRDSRLNARNAFAATNPPEQRRILEGSFGGPFGHDGKTSFLLSGHDQQEDQEALVFAIGPSGTIQDAVPQPNRQSLLAFSITHQYSDRVTYSVRANYEYESNRNQGVGGTTLATAGTNFSHNEQQITYTQQTMIRPTLLHQFQILVGHEREPTISTSPALGIVVAGAFTGGGAQGDLVRTETHMQLTTSLAWTRGRHLVQAGFQVPDWSRRGFEDRTNFGGTFYFASLDTYVGGVPYAFIEQQGNGNLAFLEKRLGAYIKDDWQVRPGMTASFGLRYDWQNYFHANRDFAPRFSFAYAPSRDKTTVFRAGAGLFTDRSGPVAIADLLHAQPGGLVRYVITNPTYPDAWSSGSGTTEPRSLVQLAPDVRIPQTLQYSVGVDHQLAKTLTVSLTYTGSHGYHLFRSRDVNAPLPLLYIARPDPLYGVVREIESNGRQQTESLQVTLRGKVTRWFDGQMQYTFSRARNDTNGIASYPANDYDLTGEWARANFDRPHSFLLLGRTGALRLVDIGVGVTVTSAGPYSEVLGQDVFNNGRGGARPPGVARNTLSGSGFASLDLRVSRELKFGDPKNHRAVTLGLDAFNVLNRVNYGTYVGTIGSPLFGLPVSARAARQLQLSMRFSF